MLDTAFILAAGLGTRMRPLTENSAKPLLHFRGERLIERHLRNLAEAGFQRAVVNTSWHGRQLRQIVGDGSRYGLAVYYSCEDNNPLETASGLARASSLVGDAPFLLINGDIWTDIDLGRFRQSATTPFIVLVDNPPHHPSGDFALTPDQRVHTSGAQKLTYAGIGVFDSAFVESSATNGSKLGDKLRQTADQGTLQGTYHSGIWYDIGTPAALKDNS